jgi:hypothetical protein
MAGNQVGNPTNLAAVLAMAPIPLGVIRGIALTAIMVVAGGIALVGGIAALAGLFTRNRRIWLSGAAICGVGLAVAAVAGVAVARAGVNRADQGIAAGAAMVNEARDSVEDAGHRIYVEAEETAEAAGASANDLVDGKGVDENGCPEAGLLDDAVERFEHITCLVVPDDETAEINFAFNDYWLADGEYYAVLTVDPVTAQRWLDGPAPWGAEWSSGPIEDQPGFVDFAARHDEWEVARSGGSTRWATHDVDDGIGEPGDLSSGDLVAIDPVTGQVWFAYWDS